MKARIPNFERIALFNLFKQMAMELVRIVVDSCIKILLSIEE